MDLELSNLIGVQGNFLNGPLTTLSVPSRSGPGMKIAVIQFVNYETKLHSLRSEISFGPTS